MGSQETRIVVGVSDSLAGLAALRTAVSEARLRSAALVAVRAWAFNPGWRDTSAQIWRQEIANQAAEMLPSAFSTAMGAAPDDIPLQMLTCEGLPEHVLVTQADRPDDLLVIGAPTGIWRPGRTLVVRYCARHARCRLLVVPPPELARHAKAGVMARSLRREADDLSRTLSGF